MKRTTTYGPIKVADIDGYFANPPKRTQADQDHIRRLTKFVESGKAVPAIAVVYDRKTGRYRQVAGHRRVFVYRLLGITEIMAEITHVHPGEDPKKVQEEMWSEQHQGKAIVGKDFFFTALATDGRVLQNTTTRKAWKLVEDHVPRQDDRDWLKLWGAPDLLFISEKCGNYVNMYNASKKKALLSGEAFSMFFRNTLRYLVRERAQFDVRDHMKATALKPDKDLVKALLTQTRFEPTKTAVTEAA